MNYEKQWQAAKPIILAHLQDGWSKAVAFKKVGITESHKLYRYYRADFEFQEMAEKYRPKKRVSFDKGLKNDK